MSADKFVVITSINRPGEAVAGFAKWPGWRVVVVGDRKTPENWREEMAGAYEGVTYLGLKEQSFFFSEFARAVPENSYTRKMIGYAYAIQQGAAAIFDTDDDNLPYEDAAAAVDKELAADKMIGERVRSGIPWMNIYERFGAPWCWPRGLSLENVKWESREAGADGKPWALMQFLVDGDPDVDAIYRIFDGRHVYFSRGRKYILDEGTYSPVNSQATLWTIEAFPLMFLPVGISDRVTDILRGYIAQACLWKTGYAVAFSSPIGYQQRNVHDLVEDFRQEIPLYLRSGEWCRMLLDIGGSNIVALYRAALRTLIDAGDVPAMNEELCGLFLSAAGLQT